MRPLLALVVVLTGCDQLFNLDQIEVLHDAQHGDGLGDGDGIVADARIGPCPLKEGTTKTLVGVVATSYTTAAMRQSAFGQLTSSNNMFGTGPVDTPLVVANLPFAAGETLWSPRLAAEGDEVFVVVDAVGGRRMRSYRTNGGAWTLHGDLVIDGSPMVTPTTVPGVTTQKALGARRMLIDAGSNTFLELDEISDLVWSTVGNYGTAALAGGAGSMREPALTADGLRMVYIVHVGASDLIKTAVRQNTSTAFAIDQQVPVVGTDPINGLSTPYLDANCRYLYYTNSNQDVERFAIPP